LRLEMPIVDPTLPRYGTDLMTLQRELSHSLSASFHTVSARVFTQSLKGGVMNKIKVWPHLTLVALVCAVLAGAGVALWMRHEQRVAAEAVPNAARIQRVEGEVALANGVAYSADNSNSANNASTYGAGNQSTAANSSEDQWVVATANQPFSVGDRIYTRDNSRTSLAFSGRNFARLEPNTSLDVLALEDQRTQLALRDGSAIFDVGYLAPGQLFEVATPYGAVDFNEPGLYSIGLQDNGSVLISVLSGLAQVVGLAGNGQLSSGEVLTLVGQTAADVVLSRLDGRNAGYLVDDYYRYQYPQIYDGRYSDYNAYVNDPYYFDPYRRNISYRYVSNIVPGIYDLDYYGDWQSIDGYGYAWRPRVDGGWAPYQQGYWMTDYPYGPTWVSSEPWGYAPYHYGRWVNVGSQWYWVPDAVNTTPMYSPALVAFIPLDANQIGWVPLGPGDPYAPRYYDASWQPYYLSRTDIVQPRLVNLGVPGAVAVLPVDQFGRIIDVRNVRRVDPHVLAEVRPVLDPLTLTPLRNAVIHSAWGRGKIDLPPGIAKKLREVPVVTSVAPPVPPFRKDLARALGVESVPAKAKSEKLKFRDERGASKAGADQGTKQKIEAVAPEAARGNKEAERQVRQLEQQQKQEQRKAERKVVQPSGRAQGERVGNPARQEVPRAEKPVRQEAPRVERQSVPQKTQQPRAPKAVEYKGPPAPVKQQAPPVKEERKQGPPATAPPSQGGDKGKGRKP
ncbi:MAG: DUF6600 domain-containing protein, partial [Pyrinomonadaceae bacterium]